MLPVRYSGGLIKRTTGAAFLLRSNSYFESPIKRFTAFLLPVAVQFVSLSLDFDLGAANAHGFEANYTFIFINRVFDNVVTLDPDLFNIIAAMGGLSGQR